MKRFLSLLLAVSLVISLVPVSFAEDAGITIKYNFGADMARLGINYDSGNAIKNGTAQGPLLDVLTYESTSGFYDLVSASSVKPDQNFVYYLPGTLGLRQGRYVAFEINVPEAGKYKMLVDYSYRNKDVGIMHVYHTEGAYNASTYSPTGGTLVGGYDCYDANESSFFNKIRRGATVLKTAEGDVNTFTSDAAELDIKTAGKHVITFYVPSGYRSTIADFALVSGSGSVLMGARISGLADKKATVTGIMSDGSEISDMASKGATVTFASSDENIVQIDSVTGEITEAGPGTCDITATVSYAGYTATAKSSYYVSDGGITVKYDVGGIMAKYDMKKGSSMHMSDVRYTHTDGFFEYAGASHIVNGTLWGAEYTTATRTISMNNAGGYIAYRINVPKTGDYTLSMNHDIAKNGGYVDVYVDDVRVGSYDCYGTSANFFGGKNTNSSAKVVSGDGTLGEKAVFNIKAGEHIIKFANRTNDAVSGAVRGSSGTFTLVSGDGSGAAIMSMELSGFDKGKLFPEAKMSNGEIRTSFEGDEVIFSSSDESIVVVEADGTVKDVSEGTVTLSVTVKRKGEEKSASKEYTSLIGGKGVRTLYDFGGHMQKLGFTQGSGKLFSEIDYTVTDGLYRPVGASYTGEAWEILKFKNRNLRMRDTSFIAIEVFVPERGIYDMEMWNAATDTALEVDVYVASREALSGADLKKLASITPKSSYLGAYSCYDETIPYNPEDFNHIVKTPNIIKNIRIPEAGYYVFTFTATDRVSGENKNQIFGSVGSFGLVSGEEKFLLGASPDSDGVEYYVIEADKAYLPYTNPAEPATTEVDVVAYRTDGKNAGATVENKKYISKSDDIFDVTSSGFVTAKGDGTGIISASADIAGKPFSGTLNLTAYDDTGVASVIWDIPEAMYVREKAITEVIAVMSSGNKITVPSDSLAYTYSPEGIVAIDSLGMVTGIVEGETTVRAETVFRGDEISVEKNIKTSLHSGKSEPTYYTYEKRQNARNNIKKYSWAKDIRKSAVSSGERYLGKYLQMYDMIYGEGIPRSRLVSRYGDPQYNICRYCGDDVEGKYGSNGSYGWTINAITRPWKIQCPSCKRLFPSNDFESFFGLGVDDQGYFDLDRALTAHEELFGGTYGTGYLKNELYPEIDKQRTPENGGAEGVDVTLNGGKGLRPGEKVETWGVDDSWGYVPRDPDGKNYMADAQNGIEERHAYIANYYYMTSTTPVAAIEALADAYLYTGDAKYGRAGAILLDRFADVYPSFDFRIQNKDEYYFWGADGDSSKGKLVGHITDSTLAQSLADACDILYPMLSDPTVISFLNARAEAMGLENKKSSSEKIWNNWENGILLEIYRGAQEQLIEGNFALGQTAVTMAAIALDREPETTDMIKWVYRTGSGGAGGNVLARIVNDVCRDGMGNETSENYNGMWINSVNGIADYLTAYDGSEKLALFEHPKFAKMFMPYMNKVSLNNQYANIGDNNETAELNFNVSISTFVNGFKNLKNTVFAKDLAQFIYLRNGFTTKGLKYGIFDEDPESIQEEIEALVDENPKQKSVMMAGYGFAILRDGNNYNSASNATAINNLRDFWMYFGKTDGHGHTDVLNIGVDAYGLNLSPDLGYPGKTGKDPERYQWVSATISHNTVIVDHNDSARSLANADPLHFDDSGYVKLIDVDATRYYSQTDIYRRTLVSVKVDDNISYGVDFFRVKGGESHTFSFHGQAEDAYPVENIDFTTVRDENGRYLSGKQVDEDGNYKGTYVHNTGPDGVTYYGIDVPYQDFATKEWTDKDGNPYLFNEVDRDPWTQDLWFYDTYFPRGYTWLNKVRRDRFMEDSRFAVEFDIKDYRNTIKDSKGIRLRLTQMNDFIPDEVAFAGGRVPVKPQNAAMPKTLDYMFVQRESKDGTPLDSMFMSVIEPYKENRYIKSIEEVEVTGEVTGDNMVRAVKVSHVGDKRTDYIVYATDNTKTYTVDGKFEFRGFVGVCTYNDADAVIYRYVCDGDYIAEETAGASSYSGVVRDFDKALDFGDFENHIDVTFDGEYDLADIEGRWINIENDKTQNASYLVERAEVLDDETVRLHIGPTTLVRSFKDSKNNDAGYIYNIEKGQEFVIPSSYVENASPVFDEIGKITSAAGSSVSARVNATSPKDLPLTYSAESLPRGASFDPTTATVTWKPDGSQIGDNHIAITARDSDGRDATIHFVITVYGSTTSDTEKDETKPEAPSNPIIPSTPSTPSGGGGSGGGAGGGSSSTATPTIPATKPENKDDEKDNSTSSTDNVGDGVLDVPQTPGTDNSDANVRFIDLGNHAWAKDAINALADEGIIRGTSENTFSPAANITRADFAILLVRAFKLASESEENFADVSESDYFAKELAVARNTGIVNGIGENKFAPRNNITRQDMMVIVYRALNSMEKFVGAIHESPANPDFNDVADYARDAVSALVTSGLVNGKSGKIAPIDYTTRAEVAVVIKRVTDFIAKK